MNSVDRPSFFEGQLLAAADLELAVDYARETTERHAREAHTPGVVRGMAIRLSDAAAGNGAQDAFVGEGLAVDALGRQIVVTRTTPIVADPVHGLPDGSFAVYAWLTETPVMPNAGVNPCATVSERVQERANVGILTDAAQAASLSAVRLGTLTWKLEKNAFVAGPTRTDRRGGGVRAHEIVAPEDAVVVHAETGDRGPTTFSVEGTIEAVAPDDGTPPKVRIPGGTLELCRSDTDVPARTVTLGYARPTATSTANTMVVGLGNNEPQSALRIDNPGGPVAWIDGTGKVHAATGEFDNVTASASVVVGGDDNMVRLAATPPGGRAGVAATHSLPLQFGTAPGDQAMFVAGATPVVVVDKTTLTVTDKQLTIGTLDASTAGMAANGTDHLELRTANGDVLLRPGPGATPFLRFTAQNRVINQPALGCDVTPVTWTNAGQSVLRLGPLAVAFGDPRPIHVTPISQELDVTFPFAFTNPPAFFVNAYAPGRVTVSATTTHVDALGAKYKIVHFFPDPPDDGNDVTWTNQEVDVIVSWVAFGVMP